MFKISKQKFSTFAKNEYGAQHEFREIDGF